LLKAQVQEKLLINKVNCVFRMNIVSK